ncbi:hypothetical protein ACOSP7_027040 [Xanthoceras sorbifolium]
MVEEEIVEFDEVYDPDIENAQLREYHASSLETRDFALFLREKRSFCSYLSEFLQRIECSITQAQASLLKPVKTYSSLRSLVEVASLKRKSVLGELEEGILNLEQLMNLCEKVDSKREWVALEHHYKPDSVGNLSHPNLVKPLFVFGFTQRRSLENHLFIKYPAIEPESCNKRLKIAIGDARGLAFLHISEKQDMYEDLKSSNLLLAVTYRDLKTSNILLDRTAKSTSRFNIHDIDAAGFGFTALNIPSASPQCRKTDVKIEKKVELAGAPRAKNIVEKASQWWHNRSNLHKTWPMKVKNESQGNVYHVLLLISTLLATITFHTALKFYLPGCRFQEGYESNCSLNLVFQIEHQSSYLNRIFIVFNSVAFFLSAATMMILFNELPFRPWLLVLVFSMVGSYMCTLMDPVNPSSFSS